MNTLLAGGFATAAPIQLERVAGDEIVARVRPDVQDPVFAGHYPGFPLLPGVYIVEFAHRAVLAVRPDLVLAEIVACRFLLPVGHGDELVVTVRADGDDHHAAVAVAGVTVTEVVLRYRNEKSSDGTQTP